MARTKLLHLGEFSQEFFQFFYILNRLEVWESALLECSQRTLRVIFMAKDEERIEKNAFMTDRRLPPNHPCPFLTIS